MDKFIALSGIDPFSEKENAVNPIYVRPNNIVHLEPFSGPFHLQAFGPDGRVSTTGRFKQIIGGSLIFLGMGGQRIVSENPQQVLEMLSSTFD